MDNLLKQGVFIFSLDTELAWGSVYRGHLAQREVLFKQTRSCITRLLALFEKYQIHATWAVVGHLFLDHCEPVNGIKHPEIIRPKYSWFPDDWFLPDPCSNFEYAPFWYGRDIVQQILDCKVKQEIGCHSFSHISAKDPGCSRACFDSEISACQAEAKKLGITLESFVYPGNKINYLNVLSEHGFLTYRGFAPDNWNRWPRILTKLYFQLRYFYPIPPPLVLPIEENGIWNLPMSYYYPTTYPWKRLVQGMSRVYTVKQSLKRAAKKRRMFHLWFHPFELARNPDKIFREMESIFVTVCSLREKGLLENPTMRELAHTLYR